MSERIGFVMKLRPGQEAEYRARHEAVWPELLADLKEAGARNYSIFLRGDDLFAYLEVDDFDAFTKHMAASEANARWQSRMEPLIDPLTDPTTGFHTRIPEVFHLE
jgi:L-rhamnose mutarotase